MLPNYVDSLSKFLWCDISENLMGPAASAHAQRLHGTENSNNEHKKRDKKLCPIRWSISHYTFMLTR